MSTALRTRSLALSIPQETNSTRSLGYVNSFGRFSATRLYAVLLSGALMLYLSVRHIRLNVANVIVQFAHALVLEEYHVSLFQGKRTAHTLIALGVAD